MDNYIVREATIDDVEKGLLYVFIEGYRFHQNGRPDVFVNLTDDQLKQVLLKNNFDRLKTIVISDNEEIVGYLSYRISDSNSRKLDVDQLVIKESYRRTGLGKKLIDEAKNIGVKNECNRIELNCWLFNQNAIDMYEHIGFNRQRIMYELKL